MKTKLRKIGNTKRNKLVKYTLIKYKQMGVLLIREMARQELLAYLNTTGLLRTK